MLRIIKNNFEFLLLLIGFFIALAFQEWKYQSAKKYFPEITRWEYAFIMGK